MQRSTLLTISQTPIALGFLTLAALTATPAQAVILNFESLAHNGTVTYPGPIYTESGFTVTNSFNPSNPNSQAYSVDGTNTVNNYTGSAMLTHTFSNTSTTLTQVGGGAFTLTSIDIADFGNRGWPQADTVNFVGTLFGGGTVTDSFTVDTNIGVETFTLNSNFTNLVSVQWTPVGTLAAIQFDNINVTGVAATAVPEPFTVLGTITAAGFAAVFKRKLAKQQDNKDII